MKVVHALRMLSDNRETY